MKQLALQQQWVLVTGASAGLGRAVASELARHHRANLLLVARRGDLLQQCAAELTTQFQVGVEVLVADLANEADVAQVAARAKQRGVTAAVLNAGMTKMGGHEVLPFADFKHMLALNVTGTVQLASELVPHFRAQGGDGALLLVSSIAGLIPLPYQAAYAATKAFLISFGASLGEELAGSNVSVTVFAPGGIDTDLVKGAGMSVGGPWLASAKQSAADLVDALVKRRGLVVPGLVQRLGVWSTRLLPQQTVVAGAGYVFRRLLKLAP
ncbi:MAG: SDR family NAD(P)-dependent oxidoreductase [Myxococcales bacterium]|nr:SDR family NAD(P)-dependent oxidoreductase [Myxococcales bacterium]